MEYEIPNFFVLIFVGQQFEKVETAFPNCDSNKNINKEFQFFIFSDQLMQQN